jgi:hypothetical protein
MQVTSSGQLGPGSYNVSSATNKKMRNTNYIPFSTSENRFHNNIEKSLQVPGPGSYQQKTIVEQLTKKPWGKQGVFGSTEKRFVQAAPLQTPGPG